MAEQTAATPSPDRPSGAQALARFGPGYAALVGLVSLAILLQGVFAGVFIQPGAHSGALDAHMVNADVAVGISFAALLYAVVLLRGTGRALGIGSGVLFLLLVALDAIGHAITDSGDDDLTAVHVPLALLAFGLTIWLSVRVRSQRKASG
jgi:hypothetical protein